MDDFANAPKSITELRSDRSNLAKDLTARDVIVMLLRDIDSGKIYAPDYVCLCFAKRGTDGGVLVNEYVGGEHNPLEVIGLLERSKQRLLASSED